MAKKPLEKATSEVQMIRSGELIDGDSLDYMQELLELPLDQESAEPSSDLDYQEIEDSGS